ncbi:IclR family transcriptional regulator [Nocardia terpenica]|uniref:Glycerol operon regulatory protein n=1 Tax=Nocardia terpenica TaxID=455432 RepID=A0A164M1Q1_9NOCA|nr:IclR family transcriptional regulator [Nocardia terpenica]KZM72944.1 IclR family transcriptional regulator [Nocardia terpenica]NQE92126.1 IclR family transcriptional regulator [Nocardia terpenica]
MANSNGQRERSSDGGVQSVDRALSVLEILARKGEAGVSEIAGEIGVHKSTVFRLLGSLEDHQLVAQTYERGKYRLSMGILRLAAAVPERLEVTEQGHLVCERLAHKLGETVNVAVLRSHFAVNLDQARGPASIGTHNWIGQPTPAHATSSGKILLAHLEADLRAQLLREAGLPRFTEHTITSRELLQHQLDAARGNGFAMTVEEYEIGLNAIAAPIRNYAGHTAAALSVSGPVYRFTEERMLAAAPEVMAAAAEISEHMGFRDTYPPGT